MIGPSDSVKPGATVNFRKDPHGFSLAMTASEASVREALAQLRQALVDDDIGDSLCSSVEIALAEALNNIAEHAYPGDTPGPVDIAARINPHTVTFELRDNGREMPGSRIPDGILPDNEVPLDDLPEGGFGWFLLHSLTQSLNYEREDGQNRLTLTFARD